MNTSIIKCLLLSATLAAAFTTTQTATAAEAPEVPKTRAEVIADTQIWRESGLAALQETDSTDFHTDAYLQAQRRYERTHASPRFAELVEQIARERGERVVAASR